MCYQREGVQIFLVITSSTPFYNIPKFGNPCKDTVMILSDQTRTVAKKSSIGGLYVCAGGLYVRAGGIDIQFWQKFY